jgi:hypothetical protein
MKLVEEVADIIWNTDKCDPEKAATAILRLVAERQREPSEAMKREGALMDWPHRNVYGRLSKADCLEAAEKIGRAMSAQFWRDEGIEYESGSLKNCSECDELKTL